MSSEQPDASFLALPASLRTKIDRAFDRAVSGTSSSGLPRTKAKQRAAPASGFVLSEDDEPAPGGFLLDDAPGGFLHDDAPGGFIPEAGPSAGGFLPDDAPGGFIVEDEDAEETDEKPTHIAFSQIPTALQMLDLPPDDDEVLAVFKNAASGWSEGRAQVDEESVSRKDWRAVCAVLLEAEGEGGDLDEAAEDEDEDAPMEEFRPDSAEESEGNATSDEYVEEPVKKTRKRSAAASGKSTPKRRTRRRGASPSDTSEDEEEEQERPLTARQKRECLKAFALFFPDLTGEVDEDSVKGRRLGIRELTKAAGALKEKIKAEEMLEMLEVFSTTPDKTMGLADFERMMVSTKMA